MNNSVFISYSHESDEHKKKAHELSNRLRDEGLDCNIDTYEANPPEGWPKWMLKMIEGSKYVLIIFSKIYYEKLLGKITSGNGVKFESHEVIQEIYENKMLNSKFIPVVFTKNDLQYIPNLFKAFTIYNLGSISGYKKLYRYLTNQPEFKKPPVGKIRKLDSDFDTESELLITDEKKINSDVAVSTGKLQIDIKITGSINDFSDYEKDNVISTIAKLLEMEQSEVKIVKTKPGSVILTLELPADKTEKLLWAIKSGELNDLGVLDASMVNDSIEENPSEKNQNDVNIEREEIFSKAIRAGKRTYFFDVKTTRNNDYYLTITESKKRFNKDGRFYYEKHKIFIYKEDFENFINGLVETIDFIKETNPETIVAEEYTDVEFEDVEFEDLEDIKGQLDNDAEGEFAF